MAHSPSSSNSHGAHALTVVCHVVSCFTLGRALLPARPHWSLLTALGEFWPGACMKTAGTQAQSVSEGLSQDVLSLPDSSNGPFPLLQLSISTRQIKHVYGTESLPQADNLNGSKIYTCEKDSSTPFHAQTCLSITGTDGQTAMG